jgi:ABC-type nitrate/sulfonate/bicarbonate transport system ATPase subunit
VIEAKDISFQYSEGGRKVLDKITFSLEKGKTLAIVGASGCGKSTLLRIISGILPCTKNDQLQEAITVNNMSPDDYRQTGKLAFMFQEATLMPHLTVQQNVALPLKIKGTNNEQLVEELIDSVGLKDYSGFLPKQLSGGMKTRVALARSFSTNPELLLLDEPFSALDIAWKSKLYIELEELKEQNNTTVVIVTHDVQEALLLADQIIILGKQGDRLFDLNLDDVQFSIMSRLNDISNYNRSESFQSFYAVIQKLILTDGARSITNFREANTIFTRIQSVAGDEDLEMSWEGMEKDVYSIRAYSNNKEVNEILFSAFKIAKTLKLKYNLIWDILEFESVSGDKIESIKKFYFDNLEENSSLSLKAYELDPKRIFEHLVNNKIEPKQSPETKIWIYLCDMYASDENEKVITYLGKVINGEIVQLNYPLAKEVANKVKEKINNEK